MTKPTRDSLRCAFLARLPKRSDELIDWLIGDAMEKPHVYPEAIMLANAIDAAVADAVRSMFWTQANSGSGYDVWVYLGRGYGDNQQVDTPPLSTPAEAEAHIEELVAAIRSRRNEGEEVGGCSCGTKFYTNKAADEHQCGGT